MPFITRGFRGFSGRACERSEYMHLGNISRDFTIEKFRV